MASRPRVFNIPASAEFLPVLIRALVDDRLALGFKPGDDPLALAGVTIYLPTRRACRLAQKRFLDVLGRDAAILPRIVPIGDIDADEIDFAEAAAGTTAEPALELPEALGGLERKMLLAELILKWADTSEMRRDGGSLVANSPASALALAGDLARLMDDMVTRQVPWSKLDTLVPEEHDEFWQKTLRFLRIARDYWPAALTERGKIDPADRRNRLIDAEAARLQKHDGPVIAAGSTGSIPATATLLATIARLPRGAVVLPGLDTDLDAATWDIIAKDGDVEAAHGHPQFAMQALLQKIGIAREEVAALAEPKSHGRERIASEALRPAAASELWQQRLTEKAFAAHADAALDKLSVIEAANAEEEALAIAVALREAVETPDKTAALVTPDRALARRVLAALKRWQVPVDDSGGDVLPDTPAGVFAQLAAEAAIEGLPPVTLLALLKHPLCKFHGQRAVATLERAVLRGPRPKRGSAGLAQALATFAAELGKFWRGEPSSLHRSEPRAEIHEGELAEATALAAELKAAFAPLEDLPQHPHRIADLAGRHAQVVQALGTMTEELAAAFDEINATGSLEIKPGDYPELFHAAIADRQVRRPERDVRVRIYGPLEARLQTVDRLVLGGLVEGVWPPQTPVDPWLSRPMRHQLGLDLPERRIGLSAHDFAQALGAREVVLSRAAKLSGAPTVASRFVQRLAAVAGKDRWEAALKQGAVYADYARTLDAPGKRAQPVSRPEPKPPREVRPSALSVTEIELWLRDPYSIYARHILRLRPLDEIDTPPGARDRGTVVHGAIGDFTAKFKDRLPDDIVDELLKLGRQHFAALEEFPDAKAFWWPRFLRVANWFADFEAKRRVGIAKIEAEIRGTVEIPLKERVFTLSARADRIEKRIDGKYAIVDYKTGRTSSAKEVRTGLAPQLTLEAAILRAGRFGEIASGASIAELLYVSLRGVNPPGELRPIQWDDTDPDTQADTALKRLTSVVTKFDDPDTPYRSRERPMFMRRNPGYYDHLARVKEWSLSGGADDDAEAGNE